MLEINEELFKAKNGGEYSRNESAMILLSPVKSR